MPYDTTHLSKREKNSITAGLWAIFVATFIVALYGADKYASCMWGVFAFKEGLADNWSDVFTKYFFIVVALERAAAVWVGLDRNEKKRAWDRRVKRLREILAVPVDQLTVVDLRQVYYRESKIIKEIIKNSGDDGFLGIIDPYIKEDGTPASPTKEEEKQGLWSYVRTTKQIYEFKQTTYEETTYKLTTRIVFVGGVILAVVGLSIFNDILDVASIDAFKDAAGQRWWYRLTDILVTGGLLGGGSKGFSVFINTLDKVFNRVKDPKGED